MAKVVNGSRLKWFTTAVIAVLILGIIGALGYKWYSSRPTQIPNSIKTQVSFNPIMLQEQSVAVGDSQFKVDKNSFKFEKQQEDKIISFNLISADNKVTISEQQYPDILIYDKLVGTMNQYDEAQTKIGKIALVRPATLNGQQTIVLSTYNGTSGVLLFAKPDKDLTKDQWIQLFNNLEVVK